MKVKEESEKVNIFTFRKLNIQKTKIMASGSITSWQIGGETMKTVADFIFGGSKITAEGDCSHEIKRCLFLGRKAMTNLDNILKSRDSTLPTKVHPVKAMVFPVVMYGCESWTVKKAGYCKLPHQELWREPGVRTHGFSFFCHLLAVYQSLQSLPLPLVLVYDLVMEII